ncbi:GNAT family N-acetyltransferase [Streptomyces lichenis]|uniref:Lysine N-acyltransferase MbtK n=1 Tax=Streptomyces lichenis TaxID=2306967 RepID=A0ABT0I3H2_9ACTN|nr:GNAT family N-acetyltransferase [Streptomyces lichenis]MCK8675875.1 acetyltransferase [Streptomyces lichenis]
MPPPDPGAHPGRDADIGTSPEAEALFGARRAPAPGPGPVSAPGGHRGGAAPGAAVPGPGGRSSADVAGSVVRGTAEGGGGYGAAADPAADDRAAAVSGTGGEIASAAGGEARPVRGGDRGGELVGDIEGWGPVATTVGRFRLVPVRLDRDLAMIAEWMNEPAVAAFWELAGPESVTADHLLPQLDGDGRSVPCLGVLDGVPMSYFEIYRADLDPLASAYPAREHDTGVHLLMGGAAHRGRGVGTALLRAVTDLVLDHRPACTRVVAEPDLRNTPSVSAFLSAGYRYSAELDLPDKRAALMVSERSLRHLL